MPKYYTIGIAIYKNYFVEVPDNWEEKYPNSPFKDPEKFAMQSVQDEESFNSGVDIDLIEEDDGSDLRGSRAYADEVLKL